MIIFGQVLMSGLMLGGIYGLMALGIILIYKSTKVFNFAHGELVLIGTFLFYSFLVELKLNVWISTIGLLLVAVMIGLILERFVLRPLIGQPILIAIMATIGISLVFKGVQNLFWPGPGRFYPKFISDDPLTIGGLIFSRQHLIIFLICILAFLLFAIFFNRTSIGLAMRATAEDHRTAQSTGIDVNKIFALTWILSGSLAMVGGALLGSIAGVTPSVSEMGLKAFPAVLLGGVESIAGALVAGLIVGTLEVICSAYLDAYAGGGMKDVVPYIILIFVLVIKPYGLFGLREIERV